MISVQKASDTLKGQPHDLVELLEKAGVKVSLDLLVNLEKRIEVRHLYVASRLHHLFF